MESPAHRTAFRFARSLAAAAGVLILSAVAFSTEAQAHDRARHHARHHRHHDGRHIHHGFRHGRHARFVVPRQIHHHRHAYRPYFWGDVYYAPHRHAHVVYSFPVYTTHGVVYHPYAYCDEGLFASGYFTARGPRFAVHVAF